MRRSENRGQKLKLNTIFSVGYQLTNVVCSFILPRLILQAYGSEVNGLVNSITQFLQVIGFLELGVGAVVQSALYKPLAQQDEAAVSAVMTSAQRFFRRIAYILLVYVAVLTVVYPVMIDKSYDWIYTACLMAAISISMFAQYYFGVVDSLLLLAHQRGYVQYITQIVTLVMNTAACALLIYMGAGIHVVKLTTSLMFLLRPVVLRWYVNRHYRIDRKAQYRREPIPQKWNGVAQHIAGVVMEGTDVVVLTLFSTLENVSVYSVYHMVIAGIKGLFMSLSSGVRSLLGELWAKQELESLRRVFGWFEWSLHTAAVFVFGCTGVLILPFVTVYTQGISDADYLQPLFAVLLTAAYACHSLRLPYSVMILAGVHYKQTQRSHIIAAVMNMVISLVAVAYFGLVGVALGTLAAMLYQTVWMAWYLSKNLIEWPFRNFLKQLAADGLTVLLAGLASSWLRLGNVSYLSWVGMAFAVAGIWLAVILGINWLLYPKRLIRLWQRLCHGK